MFVVLQFQHGEVAVKCFLGQEGNHNCVVDHGIPNLQIE